MRKLRDMFWDDKAGGPNDAFYVLAYFVLTHAFFWKFLVPGQMVFGTDIQNQSYPIQHMAVKQMLDSGSLMLWNPYIFSGMPFLASFSFPFFYPGALLFFILPLGFAMGYEMVLHFFLMGVFLYAFLRHLKLSREAAFIGGLMFMFNAHLISLVYPGHGGKIMTVTFLPIALLALDRGFVSRPLYNFGILGLMVGLMFYGGHPQILFYCGIALALFFVFLAVARFGINGPVGTLRLFGWFTAAFVAGVLLYAVILFPAAQYRSYTHRAGGMTGASSYQFATSFSQPPEDMLYIPLRNPFGWGKDYGPKIPTTDDIFYRGRIGLRLSIDYMSVFGMVLALVGAIYARNRYSWYFASLALLSMFLALGGFNPLYVYVYRYVPGFSLFRVPYAIMILLPICWGALSAYGMQRILDMEGKKRGKELMPFVYTGTAVSVLLLAAGAYLRSDVNGAVSMFLRMDWVRKMLWGYYADAAERLMFFTSNLLLFAVLLALSMVLLFAYRKGWLSGKKLALAAAIFIVVDLWPVGWQFIKTVPTSTIEDVYFEKTPAIETIMSDREGPFRVFSLVTNNELLYYGIESMTGYHAVVLGYYERVIGRLDLGGPLLDLLNAKYLMLPKKPEYDFRSKPGAAEGAALEQKYELLDDRGIFFYRNRSVLPRGFLVNRLWVAQNEDQALSVITDRRFRPRAAAVVAEAADFDINADADLSGQKVEVTSYETDQLELSVDAPADSFLVLSEVWYPGWKAYLDGREVRIFRTDYLLRGVYMPAGSHKLRMVFSPPLFKLGAAVSLLALALLMWIIGREHLGRRAGKGAGEEVQDV